MPATRTAKCRAEKDRPADRRPAPGHRPPNRRRRGKRHQSAWVVFTVVAAVAVAIVTALGMAAYFVAELPTPKAPLPSVTFGSPTFELVADAAPRVQEAGTKTDALPAATPSVPRMPPPQTPAPIGPVNEPKMGMPGQPFAPDTGTQRCGTAIDFVNSPAHAATLARQMTRLQFLLHVSGHFEDSGFT
jgi:hypothetical protein